MRLLVVLHRWLGIGLCLLFLAWFASGIVMMYVPFPALTQAERLERAASLDLSDLRIPLTELLGSGQQTGRIDRARLISAEGRPVLVVERRDSAAVAFDLQTLGPAAPLTSARAHRIAARFSGSSVENVRGPIDTDQWVVHQAFDRYRPYFRVALSDTDATNLYVSAVTGEVLQRTTRRERAWNYLGAVVHWIYPTFIRKHWNLWDQLVWWLSLAGIAGALLGLTLGIIRLREAWRRGRRGLASPFAGWLRWHHKLGLVTGVFVATWIFSGWLSMDHGRLFSWPEPTPTQVEDFRGLAIEDALAAVTVGSLQRLSGAHEIEISAVAGEPLVIARYGDGRTAARMQTPGDLGSRTLADSDIGRAVRAAWPATPILGIHPIGPDDAYAHLREGSLGDNTLRVVLGDTGGSWVHVNLDSGRIVSVMDRGRRIYRWLFNGLHSLDFPGLVDRRPLWDVTMLVLLGSGLVFSATGVTIGYRRALARRPRSGTGGGP